MSNCNITRLSLNASLRSAQAQVQNAKANLDTLISPRTEKQIQAAAALEQARLSLEQARRSLADATDHRALRRHDHGGQHHRGASGRRNALMLADMSQLHVDVLVDETEIANLKSGRPQITLDAVTGITLTGTVANIDPSGTVAMAWSTTACASTWIDQRRAALKLDMTANAAIIGEKARERAGRADHGDSHRRVRIRRRRPMQRPMTASNMVIR